MMKKFLKKNMKCMRKLFLCLLMIGSCINVSGLQSVSAATYTMNDLNFMYGVQADTPVTYNDGTYDDDPPYIEGCKTILITTTGRYLYCLQHSKDVSNNTTYTSDTAKDLIAEAETDTSLTVNEKYVLIQRVLSLAPTSINVDYSTSGTNIIRNGGNVYQWFAAQIIVWEIMVGERNADGTYKGVTRSGATSVWDALDWVDSTVESTVKSYYDSYSSTIIAWGKIPSFTAKSTSSAPTYELTDYDGDNYYTTLTDTNEILGNYTFSGDSLSFTASGNTLKVTAKSAFDGTVTVSGTNSLESGKKNLICLDPGDSDLQITAMPGSSAEASSSAYFKVKIGAGSLKIAKQDSKGNYIANTSFKLSYNSDMSDPIGTYTTGSDGTVTIDSIYVGTVYVQETSVPDNLILDSTVHSVTIKSGETSTYTATNDWKQGYIQVTKYDSKTGQVVKQAGVEFEILSGSTVVETITTNANGIAKSGLLDYGTYTIREKTNPENYVIVTTTKSQSVTENGKTYSVSIYNEPVVGSITITKEDSETGTTAQGDATLTGATYVLKAKEDILDPASGEVLYSAGTAVSSITVGNSTWGDTGEKTTDDNGQITWSNLPMGSYVISETKASTGYVINEETYSITLTPSNNTSSTTVKSVTVNEDVIKGKLQISKAGTDGESGVIAGLEGVEFTIKLYSEVQSVGWDEATTYDVMTTDSSGRATSQDLPYGVYLVKETYTPENYYAGGDFFVTIDEDGEVEYRMVNNVPFKAWLKIIKSDEEGNAVTLSNASFKLKDSEGNYVIQKTGQTYIDTWTTDADGIVCLDNMVYAGTYYIEEITTPEGFLLADEVEVEIASSSDAITFDEDNDPVITVNIVDEKPTGTIILNKSTEISEDIADKGIKFQLTANSDIIDPTDGSVIYSKGDIVTKDYSDGIYEIDEKGIIQITDLPLGTDGASYLLTEVETQDGYVLLEDAIEYTFSIEDTTTKVYEIEKSAENKLTETYFSKIDVAGNEVEGAQMVLRDNTTDTVIDEWTSTNEEHLVKGLIYGHEYTLSEKAAPDGYVVSTDITFTYSTEIEKVTMTDKQVLMTKEDVGGQEVAGAKIQVIDADGNVVDEWTSTSEAHAINGLVEGQTYTLHEEYAPDGYVIATDIEFTVTKEKVNQEITLIDKQVSVSKEDVGGQEVEGATIQVLDADGNIVDEWVSTNEVHLIKGLNEGQTYTLHEEYAPDGYVIATDVEFTVTEEKVNQEITLVDKQVFVSKEDIAGEEVEGATIQVLDEDGYIVDEWISTKEAHAINGLEEGKTYILHEEAAPNGYYVTNDVTFSVSNDKVNEYHHMIDEKILTDIQVIKIDASTQEVIKGLDFMFTLYSDKECTHEITSAHANTDTGTVTFENLEYGTYYILETQAPKGYQLSNEVVEVVIDDDLQNAGGIYVLKYANTPIPAVTVITGDNTPIEALWWTTFVVGMSGVYLTYKKKKYLENKVD